MDAAFVDSHLHLWDRARFQYDWLENEPALPYRFLPEDVPPAALRSAIFVQAECRPEQGVAEAVWVDSLAERWPALAGIVAFAPVEQGAAVDGWLAALSEAQHLVGVRRLLQDEPAEWLARTELVEGLRRVADADLVFDACVRHHQLEALLALRRAVPNLRIVLDHLGKPPVAAGWGSEEARAWAAGLQELAAEPSTFVKLSGLVPELPAGGSIEDALPFLEWALEHFGADRAMAGSDWPVSAHPSDVVSYEGWFEFVDRGLRLSPEEREAVLVGTASVAYLEAPRGY